MLARRTSWLSAMLLVMVCSAHAQSDLEVVEVVGLIKSALGVVKFVGDTWNELMSNSTGVTLPELPQMAGRDAALLARFRVLSKQLESLDESVTAVRHTLLHIERGHTAEVRWQLTVETLENLLRPINSVYERFQHYQRYNASVETHTLLDFAEHAVSHDPHSLQSTMNSLHDISQGLGLRSSRNGPAAMAAAGQTHSRQQRYAFKQGLFQQLEHVLTNSKTKICELQQSPQQLAYALYGIVSLSLAKAYAMVQFSYMLLRLHGKGEFRLESRLSTRTYQQQSFSVADEAQQVLRGLSAFYWRCDPAHHRSGVSFLQLTELLQGYLENEVDLNADGTCNNNCAYYDHAKRRGCYMVGDASAPSSATSGELNKSDREQQKRNFMICNKQRACRGKVHDCRFFDSDSTVCMAGGRDASHRRYDWIQFEDGQTLGHVATCSSSKKVDSWWRNLFWHCSYCFCLCDDPTTSDRYFSLQPQVADVSSNMVVTGVRWVKRSRVFYIQIEQGEADRFGFVNASTVHWKPIKNTLDVKKAIADRDYMALSWERRAIDLDDLTAPDGHVVTGVAFRKLGEHLNLEIQVTPIAARTARLTPSQGYWLSNDQTPSSLTNRRTEFTGHADQNLPTRAPGPSWPDSSPGTFLRFSASSVERDVAQTTLPFIDSQAVAPRPAVWLTGLGLFHKGAPGYGGYLALRVHTVDLTSRVAAEDSRVDEDGVIEYESRERGDVVPLVV